MSAESMRQNAAEPASRVATAPTRTLSPWSAAIMIAVFWTLRFIVGSFDKPYFFTFLFTMGSSALLALIFLVWWWACRRIRLVDRFLGFLLIVGGCVGAIPCFHKSFGWFGLLATAMPAVLTTWTFGLIVQRWCRPAWIRPGAVLLVAATLGSFALGRIEGVDSDLSPEVHWRWSSSAEERFLAERTGRSADTTGSQRPAIFRDGDWGEFRGADRDGVIHAPPIATDWQKTPPRMVWRQRVGPAWSSVIVVDGRLFTQEQHGEQEAVVCYDAATGKGLWTHEDPARFWEATSGAGPRATPTFHDSRLFALGATGILNCLDAATGKTCWHRDIAVDADTKVPQWGFSGSPLLVDGLLIVYAGGGKGLFAYQAATGEPAWSVPVGTASYSSPQLATLAATRQCLMLSDNGLTAVDPPSGAVLWKNGMSWQGAPRAVQPHVLSPSQLVVGTLDGFGTTLLDVRKEGDTWKTDRRWTSRDLKPEFPDFVVHQGHAYGFDVNIFCCIDLSTGKRCWKGGRYGRGQVVLLAEQSLLLVATETGEIVVLTASPSRHEELGRFPALDGKTWNHPVLVGQRLYLRNAEEMACYEVERKGE